MPKTKTLIIAAILTFGLALFSYSKEPEGELLAISLKKKPINKQERVVSICLNLDSSKVYAIPLNMPKGWDYYGYEINTSMFANHEYYYLTISGKFEEGANTLDINNFYKDFLIIEQTDLFDNPYQSVAYLITTTDFKTFNGFIIKKEDLLFHEIKKDTIVKKTNSYKPSKVKIPTGYISNQESPKITQTIDPTGRFSVFKNAMNYGNIFFKELKSDKTNKLMDIDHSIDVLWTPDGNSFLINDFVGPGGSPAYVCFSTHPFPKNNSHKNSNEYSPYINYIDLQEETIKSLGEDIPRLKKKGEEYFNGPYYKGLIWLNSKTLLFSNEGYIAIPNVEGYDYKNYYIYNLGGKVVKLNEQKWSEVEANKISK